MEAPRECLVMAKPAGPRCDLRCSYCYYLAKVASLPRGPGRLPMDLLERYIAGRMDSAPGKVVHFEWHGGEPTLLGLDYFRAIVRLQRAQARAGKEVRNGLQTNGCSINGAWASFLAKEGFSVGLSLDGPAEVHDANRRTASSAPTHDRVEAAYRLLVDRGVFVNLLAVLGARSAVRPDEVYGYFRSLGAKYLQFLPLVPGNPGTEGLAATAEEFGTFLCRVFDLWIKEDLGGMVVQNFDEALRPLYGLPHALCVHRETCGQVAVLERDGGFYACDHFVDEAHLIGNIRERSLLDLSADPALIAFGEAKKATLPSLCLECGYLEFCNGGCPKDRDEAGLNRLCAGYKLFFAHAKPGLTRLAAHMKAGRALRDFRGKTETESTRMNADERG